MDWQTFPSLDHPALRHGFSLRATVPLPELREHLDGALQAQGYPCDRLIEAEQPHGAGVGVIDSVQSTQTLPAVDALATNQRGQPLLVRVADCGAVYFYDPVRAVIALAHSGRKGTEQNIVGATIRTLQQRFGSQPSDLIVQLGPCIRPPRYEVDFAAQIKLQASEAGVLHFHDCLTCTASNLSRYYSYRAEKGQTGRMYAILMLR
jgi:YfiH family protein